MLSEHYPAFLLSNEPDFDYDPKQKISGHFTYIGTSVLKNLEIIKKIAGVTKADVSTSAPVPKLFIVDNSAEVNSVWELLKKNFSKSNSFLEFRANLTDIEFANGLYANARETSAVEALIHCANYLSKLMKVDPATLGPNDLNEDDWYQYFKRIVTQMELMNADWRDKSVFENIKNQIDLSEPVVVYASNIVEYVLYSIPDLYAQNMMLGSLIGNIRVVNPSLTIHSRTLANNEHLHPGAILTLNQEDSRDFEKHQNKLLDVQYRFFGNTPRPNLLNNVNTVDTVNEKIALILNNVFGVRSSCTANLFGDTSSFSGPTAAAPVPSTLLEATSSFSGSTTATAVPSTRQWITGANLDAGSSSAQPTPSVPQPTQPVRRWI